MRQAAVMAGLVPDTPAGHARVHFVTEGEASLNFCIRNGLTDELVGEGKSVMIVDAGGGTVDVSTYLFTSVDPLSVEEIVSADCILQGSTRVTVRAEEFLKERLKDSKYRTGEDIKCMRDYFDKSTKTVFRSADEPYYIKFGSMRCHDPDAGIRRGKLMLSGAQMLSFFKPSLAAIVQVLLRQRQAASLPLAAILLVGGFAANPWLYSALQEELSLFGLPLFRPDAHTSKAVAEGAVSYHLEHFVSARVMKLTYGIEVSVKYDHTNPEHYARQADKYVRASGRVVLRKGFSTIVGKGKSMLEGEQVSSPYFQEARRSCSLDSVAVEILCYRGKDVNPLWVDVHPLMYAPLCTICADTSRVVRVQKPGPFGMYYEQKFKVVLISGLTELQAQISWIEDGVEKRGPASIVYDDDLQVSGT
ncbi:hypothetical protein C8Q78DRAFT_1048352 [Trametes maxima]|nr:hypothetical protein C8Q78DRAFT_1048352 [Trametes maxima]